MAVSERQKEYFKEYYKKNKATFLKKAKEQKEREMLHNREAYLEMHRKSARKYADKLIIKRAEAKKQKRINELYKIFIAA